MTMTYILCAIAGAIALAVYQVIRSKLRGCTWREAVGFVINGGGGGGPPIPL